MVVLVETATLEGDANGTEHFRDVLLRAGSAARALWGRVIGEGLNLLELFSALLAAILIRRHLFGAFFPYVAKTALKVLGHNRPTTTLPPVFPSHR